ncbi:MAG: hypothetical protein KH703_05855 [Campylobacter gracilis]|uniref:hypothetical protein n=1 Tax=Campylobacter gracilis TaxID=824 RepID=UPI0026EE8691|nr:hypothetical protein [Campylobacter gracilis]MBS6152918.1 hypothetical protein [Campylobacter gracilis]
MRLYFVPQGASCACDVARRRKRIESELNLIAAAALNFEIAFAFRTVRRGGIAKF